MFFFGPKPGDLVKLEINYGGFGKIYDGTFGIVLRVDNEQKYRVFSIKTLKEVYVYEAELKKFS